MLCLAACSGTHSDDLLAASGAEQYARYCASCHGPEARGDGPAAAALKPPPADLTRIAAGRGGHFPAPEIARFIDGSADVAAHGSREMPVWGIRFSERIAEDTDAEEVAQGRLLVLLEYLRSIQREE